MKVYELIESIAKEHLDANSEIVVMVEPGPWESRVVAVESVEEFTGAFGSPAVLLVARKTFES